MPAFAVNKCESPRLSNTGFLCRRVLLTIELASNISRDLGSCQRLPLHAVRILALDMAGMQLLADGPIELPRNFAIVGACQLLPLPLVLIDDAVILSASFKLCPDIGGREAYFDCSIADAAAASASLRASAAL